MRLRLCVLIVGLSIAAAGCGLPYLTPPGTAPVRYRDPIFSNVTTATDITYGSAVDQAHVTETLKLDMYTPTGDTKTSRPAIVWVHGGSFSSGDKNSGELIAESKYFAQRGYVNVSINYRLSPDGCSASGGPTDTCIQEILDSQHDAQAAVRFLRKNATTYGIDPTRIAIGGTSAGAITAIDVGANSEDPGTSGNPGVSSAVRGAVALSGARIVGNPMSAGDSPIMMFHGTADPLVPYQWAVNTINEAKAAGIVNYLTTYQGAGHVPLQFFAEIEQQTSNFLYWVLDLTHAS